MPSAVDCIQLVPKYTSKVKLDRGQPPIILSEIIISGENGCCGGNIPISHFLLSLTHSAMLRYKHLEKIDFNFRGNDLKAKIRYTRAGIIMVN